MCLGFETNFSMKTDPSPNAEVASLTARSICSWRLASSFTIRIPFPPPPALAFIKIGYPISLATCFALSRFIIGSAVPGTSGTLNFATAAFAASLLPMVAIDEGEGPIKT